MCFCVELTRAKVKAQEAGNLKEEARACGRLAEQYTEDGEWSRAHEILSLYTNFSETQGCFT